RAHAEALLHERLEFLRVLAQLESRPRPVLARAHRRDQRHAVVGEVRCRGLGLLARERDARPLDRRVAHQRLHPIERRGSRVGRRTKDLPDIQKRRWLVGERIEQIPEAEQPAAYGAPRLRGLVETRAIVRGAGGLLAEEDLEVEWLEPITWIGEIHPLQAVGT